MKRSLLLAAALCLPLGVAHADPIRIMPMGDSITNGTGGTANLGGYRQELYDLLIADGYAIDLVGSVTTNSSLMTDMDHEGHGGWRIDQLDSNVATWFSTIDPDIILLHIGTNDFGQDLDTPNAINRLDDLITKMAGLRPNAHIIVTNLMERGEPQNAAIVAEFNPLVVGVVNAQITAGNLVSFLDMRAAVPYAPAGNFADAVHPNQTGYDLMANAWLGAITAVLEPGDAVPPSIVRATSSSTFDEVIITFNKRLDPTTAQNPANYTLDGGVAVSSAVLSSSERCVTLTTSAQTPGTTYTLTINNVEDLAASPNTIAPGSNVQFLAPTQPGYENNVPESECFTLVYSLDLPNAANYSLASVPYDVDIHSSVGTYDRVAYYMELQTPGGDLQYAWASMDAFDTNPANIGVPSLAAGVTFQQSVSNFNVVSNVLGVTTGVGQTGNLEFWPTNYQTTNGAGVPAASDSLYDFGDNISAGNFGSMQVHNTDAAQTVISFSRWGGSVGNACIGIGNRPTSHPDWTFADNAADYTVKKLQVLVRTTGDLTAPTLAAAQASFDDQSVTVTFSEPIRRDTLLAANFSLDNGVTVLSVEAGDDLGTVRLITTTLPGAALTLTVNNLRDTSHNANQIAPASTIAVAAAALPAEVIANIAGDAAGYELVYSLDIGVTGDFNGPNPYTIDNSAKPGAFSRIAYYLELQSGATTNYVWTSMDAFTQNKGKIGVPTVGSGAFFQTLVTNLDIISNKAGLTTGAGLATGNIEFWPGNYNGTNPLSIPNASATNFDWGDGAAASNAGHGSMQVHNHGASQTLFSITNFGNDGNTLGMGIGNDPTPTSNGVDWTFAANAGTEYSKRTLHVMVLPAPYPTTLPAAVTTNIGAAANDYELIYSIDLPATGNFNAPGGTAYTVDNSSMPGSFSRIAYYLELDSEYIWTSMDAFTDDRTKIGIPTIGSGAAFQQLVSNLDIISDGLNVTDGTGIATGNIEFWPNSYNQGNTINIPGASGSTFDFGDNRTSTTSAGYGSMQVHNHGAGETLFALNRFGTDGSPLCLGIGNDPTAGNGTDWTFENNAGAYTTRTLHVMVLPSTLPAEIVTNVPESTDYELVYSLDIPGNGTLSGVGAGFQPYSLDNSASSTGFSRVAYYLELQKTGDPVPTYVWVSMDPLTQDRTQIGVPTVASGAFWQQLVTNMNVVSNSPNVTTGTGIATGNIEFWPGNYNGSNPLGIPNASAGDFDFGDGGASAGFGHGSMQIHNHDIDGTGPGIAGETLFAINRWGGGGSGTTSNDLAVGIGNNPTATNDPDYTFTYDAPTYDLVKRLHVLVLPSEGAPAIVDALGSTSLDRLVVTFDREVTDASAVPGNFSIDGGLSVLGAALLPGNTQIVLTTSLQTGSTLYTVDVSGVQDRAGGSPIHSGSSVQFTAYTAAAVLANVPDTGMELIYHLDIPTASPQWNFNDIPYLVDEAQYGEVLFDRVGYLMKLDGDWVYASFDPHTNQIAQTGVPTLNVSSTAFQQIVTNMNVDSNVAGVVTGNGIATGNIEFWGGNYSGANALSIPNAAATFDFGDTMSGGGHGSMQVHNHGASQTIMAYNNWGSNANQTTSTGIGNNPDVAGNPDWTFSASAATYTTRNLYVLARPGGVSTASGPVILVHPCDRSVALGGNVSMSVIVDGDGPFTYQWRLNGTPIGGATQPWLELSAVAGGDAGAYDVIVTGTNLGSTTSDSGNLTVIGGNLPPTFSGYAFSMQRDGTAIIPLAAILANANDTDGGTPDVTAAGTSSTAGGIVSLGASTLTYTPTPGFTGSDSISITIEDGQGGSVMGTVSIYVSQQAIDLNGGDTVAFLPGGGPGAGVVEGVFHGTPGVEYGFQRSDSGTGYLTGWTVLSTGTAGDDGIIIFNDPAPPTPEAYYRTITPVP